MSAETDRALLDLIEADDHALPAIPVFPLDVLPAAGRELVEAKAAMGIPSALTAGAVLGALAAAIGGKSSIKIAGGWPERAILWVVLIGARGSGKSPALNAAMAPIRESDALEDQDDDEDRRPQVLHDDLSLEALARSLKASGGHGAIDVDELRGFIDGLGQYKARGGADRGRFLSLWAGAPWKFSRVAGGAKTNALNISLSAPTLAIVGGLQPELHDRLGGDEDGMRPRWLPHLAQRPPASAFGSLDGATVLSWPQIIARLLAVREQKREWHLSAGAADAFRDHRKRWKHEEDEPLPAGITAALGKAPSHLARIALVLAEANDPGAGGSIDAQIIERAAIWVDFTIDCWKALPEHGTGLGLTRRDEKLSIGAGKLAAWLEARPDRLATRRDIQRARVAGCRKAADIDALIAEYEATYPTTVTRTALSGGGHDQTIIRAPRRLSPPNGVTTGDTVKQRGADPSSHAENSAVTSGDTASGDTEVVTAFRPAAQTTEDNPGRCQDCNRRLIAHRDTGQPYCPACEKTRQEGQAA